MVSRRRGFRKISPVKFDDCSFTEFVKIDFAVFLLNLDEFHISFMTYISVTLLNLVYNDC